MKTFLATIGVVVVGMTLGGCVPPQSAREGVSLKGPQESSLNAWTIETHFDQQSDVAIIRQRTVFPHHFVDSTAQLNELGRDQVRVLARHFKRYPGSVNIRHDGDDPVLLEARVESVRSVMAETGVAVDLVSNGVTGGDGITSDRVLVILSQEEPVWQPQKK